MLTGPHRSPRSSAATLGHQWFLTNLYLWLAGATALPALWSVAEAIYRREEIDGGWVLDQLLLAPVLLITGLPLWLLQSALIAALWLAGLRNRLATRALVTGLPLTAMLIFLPDTDRPYMTLWATVYLALTLISRLPREPDTTPTRKPTEQPAPPPE